MVGYKPIAFTVQPQRGLVIRGLTYPPSETYFYAPLKETVAVYQKPFRIVQELALIHRYLDALLRRRRGRSSSAGR